MSNDAKALIVPLNVLALAVSKKDAKNKRTEHFSGINVDYSKQDNPQLAANVGKNVILPLDAQIPADDALQAGVHLHWALPDALTKGIAQRDELVFPAIPNRWLVHRIQIQEDEKQKAIVTRTSWIVLSDALHKGKNAQSDTVVTLPVIAVDNPWLQYRYCGEKKAYDASWVETEGEKLHALTGRYLNAASNGLLAFSSYYPNCRGILGFHDPLTDIRITDKTLRNLMYIVSGWYSPDLENEDPLRKKYDNRFINTHQEIESTLGWTFQEENDAQPSPNQPRYYSLYHGSVQNIDWHPDREFLPDAYPKEEGKKHTAPLIKVGLSVGNNDAEAVATYLQAKTDPHDSSQDFRFQLFLTLYLLGAELPDVDPDEFLSQSRGFKKILGPLRDKRHEYLFRSILAQQNAMLMKLNANKLPEKIDYLELPGEIVEALNELNYRNQVTQILDACLENEKWQLFADWYRLIFSDDVDHKTRAEKIADYQCDRVAELIKSIREERKKTYASASSQRLFKYFLLSGEYKWKHEAAPRYWQPNDPVFLLQGDELETSRYGHNEPFIAAGSLRCRLGTQLVSAITTHQNSFDADGLDWQFDVSQLNNRVVLNMLLRESLLLNDKLITLKTGDAVTFADIQQCLATVNRNASPTLAVQLKGTHAIGPSLISLSNWGIDAHTDDRPDDIHPSTAFANRARRKNQWTPVFADWEIEFTPIYAPSVAARPIKDYPSGYPFNCFEYIPSQDSDIQWIGGSICDIPVWDKTEKYTGASLLNIDSTQDFRVKIKKIQNSPVRVLKDKSSQLQHWVEKKLLVQSFSELTNYFLTKNPSLQLDINVPNNSDEKTLTDKIRQTLSAIPGASPLLTDKGSPSPDLYNPFRAGFIKSINITLIDVFGQKRKINEWREGLDVTATKDSFFFSQTLHEAPFLTQGGMRSKVYLAPRLCQPARLSFHFLAANSTKFSEMNDSPISNPICGWLLFNRVNQSFFVHDAQGVCLGSLFINDRDQVVWRSAPGQDRTAEQALATAMPVVRSLVNTLIGENGQFFLDFRDAIDHMQRAVVRTADALSNNVALTLCRPLAIVQASMALELRGSPIYNQSLDTLKAPADAQANPLFSKYGETDNKFSAMQFSIQLGKALDEKFNTPDGASDGLFGFFKFDKKAGDYDFKTFYTYGAHQPSKPLDNPPPVRRPNRHTLLLRPFPQTALGTTDELVTAQQHAAEKLVLLIDPHETIHAFSGFLPVKRLTLPTEMYHDTIRMLGLTFLAAPILSGPKTLDIPLPDEPEYEWTWTTLKTRKKPHEGHEKRTWVVENKINKVMPEGLWDYTPQKAQEGWLQAIPHLLTFLLSDNAGNAILKPGDNDNLKLRIVNSQTRSIKFVRGAFSAENTLSKDGSIFYIHFDAAISKSNLAKIRFSSEKWQFKFFDNADGAYWAVIPTESFVVRGQLAHPNKKDEITIDDLFIEPASTELTVSARYFNIVNIHDGAYTSVVTVR